MSKPTTVEPSVHEIALQELVDDLTQAGLQDGTVDQAGAELLARFLIAVLDVLRAHVGRLPDLARCDSKRLGNAPFVGLVKACKVVEDDMLVLADGLRAVTR